MPLSKTFTIEHYGTTYRVSCLYHKTWFRDTFQVLNETSENYEDIRTSEVPDQVIIAVTRRLRILNNTEKLNKL